VTGLNAALTAAKRGWPAFFVFFKDGRKHPAVKWRDWGTTDTGTLIAEAAGRSYPAAGIECERAGLVVIDEDTLGEFKRLAASLGESVPVTYVVRTGRAGGGRQYYFKANGHGIRSTDMLRKHVGYDIDVKGAGGYVVAAGSSHPSGATYQIEHDTEPVEIPTWLVELLTEKRADSGAGTSTETTGKIGYGDRHQTLLSYAGRLRKRGLSYPEAVLLFKERWLDCVQPPGQVPEARYHEPPPAGLQAPVATFESAETTILQDVYRRYEPNWEDTEPPLRFNDTSDGPSSWEAVDLGPYLHGNVKHAEPTLGLRRADGLCLIYPGKEHAVIGEMESGKSWFACGCAAAELLNDHHVTYIHFEETDPGDTVERLQALGVPDHVILERFAFIGPDEPVQPQHLARLLQPTPTLVILDGVNEAMSLHRLAIREEDGAAQFRRQLVKPCTAAGAATIALDHVVKDRERRGRDALGSVHKGNGLTGALIMLENADPFGRGLRGRSHVYVTKDRPGHLRRNGRRSGTPGKTFLGELVVDDTRTQFSYLDMQFYAPAEQATPDEPKDQDAADDELVFDAVQRLIKDGHQATRRMVRAAVKGVGNPRIDAAAARLVLTGRLTETITGRGHYLTVPQDQVQS
jgi:hypothetical protein